MDLIARFSVVMTCLSLAGPTVGAQDVKRHTDRAVYQGIAVELSIASLEEGAEPSAPFREGEDVVVSFKIYDEATGGPIAGAYPAAWMDRLPIPDEKTTPEQCVGKVKRFLEGSIFSQVELDLNVYYILALNEEASISVVDPLFGFGGSKLLAMVPLDSPGLDWELTAQQDRLFVSMPEAGKVAVVKTGSWEISDRLAAPKAGRLALQPDGGYLWASYQSGGEAGMAVFSTDSLERAASIPTGAGPHDIAFTPDSRYAFVSNERQGTVSVVEVRGLRKLKDVQTGRQPVSLSYSSMARAVYAAHAGDGTIVAIDAASHEIKGRMRAEPGIRQIRFAPQGRLGFVASPGSDQVFIIDAASNRVAQVAEVEDEPVQIAFTDTLAYVVHAGHEDVLMIPLDRVGVEGRPVPVVDFPGGRNPPGLVAAPSLADLVVQASGELGVLVANPVDQAVYFYKEGMAAPMGNFSNYGRNPRAVLVVERNLRESEPGRYGTSVQLRRPGSYDVAFLLDAPRIVHCFPFSVAPAAGPPKARVPELKVEALGEPRAEAGQPKRMRFRITLAESGRPLEGLQDVLVLVFSPGWQRRVRAEHEGDGVYAAEVTPGSAGVYAVHIAAFSAGMNYLHALNLEVR